VIVTMLLTTRGLTVSAAVTGVVVPESLTVRVTGVSAATGLGVTVKLFPVNAPVIGSVAWSLEVTMYEPVPPLTMNVVGRLENNVAVAGRMDRGRGTSVAGGVETAPLPQAARNASERKAITEAIWRAARPESLRVTGIPWVLWGAAKMRPTRPMPRFY
jgi:hypothetical protein